MAMRIDAAHERGAVFAGDLWHGREDSPPLGTGRASGLFVILDIAIDLGSRR